MRSIFGSIFASTAVEKSDFVNPRPWLFGLLGAQLTRTGEAVGPENALTLSSYFAAVRNIAEDVAKVPLVTYRRIERGKEEAREHPIYRLLRHRPNPDASSMSFRETLTAHAIGWGGGFAEVQRDDGVPVALHPIHPSRVRILRGADIVDGYGPGGRPGRPLVYEVRNDDGTVVPLSSRDVLHVHGVGGNGIQGWSVLRYAAESLGLALAADHFGASFFQNGARVSGVLEHPERLSPQATDTLREQFAERYAGPENVGKPLVLEEGMKWSRISIPPEEAQFLQTRRMSVEDVARWLRIAPHKIGHLERSTFNNIEAQNIDHVGDTLIPWMERWEQEIQEKLLRPGEQEEYFAEHKVSGLLRGDSQARSERQRRLFSVGAMSQNDIREEEGLNPIENGDEYYVPVNMAPSKQAAEGLVGSDQGTAPGVEPDSDDATRDAMSASALVDGLRPVFVEAAERVLAKEQNACLRARKKFAGDDDALANWLRDFIEGQARFFDSAFAAPVSALRALGVGRSLEDDASKKVAEALIASYSAAVYSRWFNFETGVEDGAAEALAEEVIDATT